MEEENGKNTVQPGSPSGQWILSGDGMPEKLPGEAISKSFQDAEWSLAVLGNLTPGSTQLDGSIGCLGRVEHV